MLKRASSRCVLAVVELICGCISIYHQIEKKGNCGSSEIELAKLRAVAIKDVRETANENRTKQAQSTVHVQAASFRSALPPHPRFGRYLAPSRLSMV